MYGFKYHLLGWSLFVATEIGVCIVIVDNMLDALPKYFVHLPTEIIYFYIVSFLVFKYPFWNKQDYWAFPKQLARIIVVLICFIIINIPLWYYFLVATPRVTEKITQFRLSVGSGLYRGVYLLGYAFSYGIALRLLKAQKKNTRLLINETKTKLLKSEVEKELVIAQNAYLQTRINPHLLMNSLNFVYNSVEAYSEEAAMLIDILSQIMRYALREPEADGKISLRAEWEQVELLLHLQQIRFGRKFAIKKEIEGDLESFRIPPILLLTFVENIFKHGDIYNSESQILIRLVIENNTLYFSTQNVISIVKPSGTHIGLENARVRLNTLYGSENQGFTVFQKNNIFHLDLYIHQN
jgi:two-component system LytT family sensor kinase